MRPPVDVPRVRDYLVSLRNSWLVIVCATVLSAAAMVLGVRYLQPPKYVADTALFAVVPGDAMVHAAYEGNRGASVKIDTYAQLAKSSIVTLRTIDDLGLTQTPEELSKRIAVVSVPDTLSEFSYPMSVLMRVQVSGDDPDGTVEIANAVTTNLISAAQEVEWSDSEGAAKAGPSLILVDQAKSAAQAGPSWLENAGIGGALGAALSCLAVLGLGVSRDRVLSRGQLAYVIDQRTNAS